MDQLQNVTKQVQTSHTNYKSCPTCRPNNQKTLCLFCQIFIVKFLRIIVMDEMRNMTQIKQQRERRKYLSDGLYAYVHYSRLVILEILQNIIEDEGSIKTMDGMLHLLNHH